MCITEKAYRYARIDEIRANCLDAIADHPVFGEDEAKDIFKSLEKSIVRKRIINGEL